MTQFTDPELLELADRADVPVPRGEARKLVAEAAKALLAREGEQELRDKLAAAAGRILDDEARRQLAEAADADVVAQAVAYRAALPYLARDQAVKAPLAQLEPLLAGLDEEDAAAYAPALARVAVPALGVDVELLKDEGYRYVATYPPEGSEGVDVVGRAASWLTRRMTMDGDAPRLAMRRFLALLAEEVEVELPASSAALDTLLAEPMPELPTQDRMFLSLARGLVEEAVAERGFPF